MLSKRFRITLRRWQTPYRSIHLEIRHDSLKNSKFTSLGYFCGLWTAFASENLIEKVTGTRYTPLLKPSDSGLVMRECADVPKKA